MMIRDGKYRFSLQFPAETEKQIRVGNLLEQLGNRKSAVVVDAVNAYLLERPELLDADRRIQVKVESNIAPERLEQIIRRIVEEKISAIGMKSAVTSETMAQVSDMLEADVTQMLDNLEMFQ